jgi:hypothetical protein
MNYLERYLNGEHERVWSELQALGVAVRKEPIYSQARQVAEETMRRVRRNCERIVARLRESGYIFGVYPDGTKGYYTSGPLVSPNQEMHADQETLEEAVGPLPISLVSFWQQVGSVDLVGMHPSWPSGLDPLVVYPPEGACSDLDSMDDMMEGMGHFEGALAPDDLHKDNVSGGEPYAVGLPEESADFVVLNERHHLLFVPYLRMAVLGFAGFPGLEHRDETFEPLASLRAELEPF